MNILLQAQAINASGGISADWFLVGITCIAFFLFWRMLNRIEGNLDSVLKSISSHSTTLTLHDKSIRDFEAELEELKKNRRKS